MGCLEKPPVQSSIYLNSEQSIDGFSAGGFFERPALKWDDVPLTGRDEQLLHGHDAQAQEEVGVTDLQPRVPDLKKDLSATMAQVARTKVKNSNEKLYVFFHKLDFSPGLQDRSMASIIKEELPVMVLLYL